MEPIAIVRHFHLSLIFGARLESTRVKPLYGAIDIRVEVTDSYKSISYFTDVLITNLKVLLHRTHIFEIISLNTFDICVFYKTFYSRNLPRHYKPSVCVCLKNQGKDTNVAG
jgi:hypothetical protein